MKQNKIKLILASLILILALSSLLVLYKNSLNKNDSDLDDNLYFRDFIIYYDTNNDAWKRFFYQLPYRIELAKTTFDIKLNDSNEEVKYYEFSNHNLYFLGIEEIYLNEDGKVITLKEKLDYDKDYLIKMRNNMYYEYGIFDGGSTEYNTIYNDAFNEKIKMFTCNNMTSGNKDVHIASIDKDIMYDSCVKQK
jgi:hypothetical protein